MRRARRFHNTAFNVGAIAENYQVNELAEIVRELIPNSAIRYSGTSSPDPRNYRVDFSKIQQRAPAFRPVWAARKAHRNFAALSRRVGLKAGI